jgi:hypothetical protein
LSRAVWYRFYDVSEVLAALIIREIIVLMIEAASTSETLVNVYQTALLNNPENRPVHARRREKLKYPVFNSILDGVQCQMLFHLGLCDV